ncbi:MAG TPA: hypothetical protein ENJ79_03505 [Gammaproteobacteria bacterium]|nr:hypothetical protein [Gammaproteobacteria bacterium]
MSFEKELVERFYDVIWNRHDKDAIPDVLHESFEFRGSLGQYKEGHSGFAEYLDMVHAGLGNYRCEILEIVAEPSKAFAKMRFSGLHKGRFMGFDASNRNVTWEGAALFYFEDKKISELWVLGDLKTLESQLVAGC